MMLRRLYRSCLRLYPQRFRARFADDMARVFDARLRDASARGRFAFFAIGALGLLDVVASGLRERLHHDLVVPDVRRSSMQSHGWLSDAASALRALRRSPSMTAASMLVIAFGLGASGAIFAAVDHVLIRPLPYGRAGELAMIWSNNTHEGRDRNPVSPADAIDITREARSFVDIQPMTSFLVADQYVDGPTPDSVRSSTVGAGMFRLLAREAFVGRTFTDSATHEVVLSYGFWQRRYGSDRSVIGRQVSVSGTSVTLVGVMPEDFVFPYRSMLGPSGFVNAITADLWVPLQFVGSFYVDANGQPVRQVRALGLVGRLKPEVTIDAAQAEVSGIASRLAAAYPATNDGWGATIVPLLDQTVGALRPAMSVLLAGVTVLLLMALVNVANLLLAQGLARRRELAVRAALGASRWRLARQAVVESLVLAAGGGILGGAILYAGVPAIVRLAPIDMPRLAEIRPDVRVFLFSVALAVLSGVLVGLVPALLASARDVHTGLRDNARGSTSSPATRRLRAALVMAEIVFAMLLTTASAFLGRSFVAVLAVDPGFASAGLLTFQMNVPAHYPTDPARVAYYDDLFSRLTAIPGVVAAGGTTRLPLGSTNVSTQIAIEGRELSPAALPEVEFRRAVAEYFRAMAIPVLRGRTFTPDDIATAPRVCVINQTTAARLFPGEDPIGRRLRIGSNPQAQWITIIGIIGDVRHSSLEETPKPEVYISGRQGPPSAPFIVVRTAGDPQTLAGPVRQAVASIDPLTAIYDMKPMTEIRRESVSQRRFLLALVGLFGILSLGLAAVGVYGVMAVVVSERRAEMGIRLALGARPVQIVQLVLRQAGALALVGIGIGLAAAVVATPLMAHSLFGVPPRDLSTLIGTAVVLLTVAVVAAIVPARRAMRVDPIVTLRGE
jgi:putative ABC transport system permease protein